VLAFGPICAGAVGTPLVALADAFTVTTKPELHVLCPDAFHARTNQL